MTVPSSVAKSGPYPCNGVTDVFNYDFRIVDKAHLNVILADADGVETTLTLTTHYTVSDVGSDTGSINLTAAGVALAVTGTTLTILRNPPFTQETDLENQGAYFAETVEDRFDLSVMQIQTLKEKLDRAIVIQASDDSTTGADLSADVARLAGSADNIDTVASSVDAVNTAADNIAAIIDAPEQAAAAAARATAAGTSETNAAASATAAVGSASAASTSADAAAASAAEAGATLAGATMNTDTDVSGNSWVLDEDDMASDSAAKVPTQQSVSSAKLQKAADRTALKALSGATHPAVFLYEAGREGLFSWDSSDLSTEVAADTEEGIYVAPTSDVTGASGAWVRSHNGVLNVEWFGASTANSDNSTAINAALAMGAGAVFVPSGNYSCVETITLPNKGAVLFGAGSSGAGTDQANYPNNSRLIFTGSTARTACITQSDTGANFLHASIKNLGVLTEAGATYSWVIDLYDCIGLTLSGLTVSQEDYASGGGIRSRRVASTDVNWINRVIDCEIQVFVGGTAYALDVSWTDCQFVASNFNGGAGCIVRGNGENSFLGVQFNNAPSGLRVQKETTSAMQIMLTGCAFDACTTYGLLVDASDSPGGTDLCVTVTGCAFRNPGATYDINFVDGPAKISGPRIANSQFSVSTVTTAVNYNQAKWVVDFSNNYFASGWYPPSRTFTPAISFGGASTGITYTTQSATYTIKDSVVSFNILIQLSSKGTATGAALISGLPVASASTTQLTVGHVANMSGLTGALVAESSGGGIVLFQTGATGVANLTDASFTNSSVFRVSGTYAVA